MMMKFIRLLFFLMNICLLTGQVYGQKLTNPEVTKPPGKEIYIPNDLKSNNFNDTASQWCYQRMAYSDDIVVFWEKGFGCDLATLKNPKMRVNIDSLLIEGEKMYKYYRDSLKFVEKGKSQVDKYRIMIMLIYTEDWLATGAGYDDTIGALWVSPAATNPVGPVIAHEFGHSFQYMSKCDGNYGFRDQEYVGMFWEQCAQWMAMQLYPENMMGYHLPRFLANTQLHFLDEELRYQSVYLMEYWFWKHGRDIVGKVWRGAQFADDPIEAYQRVSKINQKQFNDEVFEYACHNITWDYPVGKAMRDWMKANKECSHKTPLTEVGKAWRPSINEKENYNPESYGYNAIQLKVPQPGTRVTVKLEGLCDTTIAGWRWGFVAVKNDQTPLYGTMSSGKNGKARYKVKDEIKELWLVVTAAPLVHQRHLWKDPAFVDLRFPYQLTFTNCQAL
jgi:hypothetical protein